MGTLGEDGEAGDDEVALGIRGGGAVEAPGVLHVGAGDRVPALAHGPRDAAPGDRHQPVVLPGLEGVGVEGLGGTGDVRQPGQALGRGDRHREAPVGAGGHLREVEARGAHGDRHPGEGVAGVVDHLAGHGGRLGQGQGHGPVALGGGAQGTNHLAAAVHHHQQVRARVDRDVEAPPGVGPGRRQGHGLRTRALEALGEHHRGEAPGGIVVEDQRGAGDRVAPGVEEAPGGPGGVGGGRRAGGEGGDEGEDGETAGRVHGTSRADPGSARWGQTLARRSSDRIPGPSGPGAAGVALGRPVGRHPHPGHDGRAPASHRCPPGASAPSRRR